MIVARFRLCLQIYPDNLYYMFKLKSNKWISTSIAAFPIYSL